MSAELLAVGVLTVELESVPSAMTGALATSPKTKAAHNIFFMSYSPKEWHMPMHVAVFSVTRCVLDTFFAKTPGRDLTQISEVR